MGLDTYAGKGSNGGVWEWTSTVFDTHEGLVPTDLFTGYSVDFFDTKHQIAVSSLLSFVLSTVLIGTYNSSVHHMLPSLDLLADERSGISTSTTIHTPGSVLVLYTMLNFHFFPVQYFASGCILYLY